MRYDVSNCSSSDEIHTSIVFIGNPIEAYTVWPFPCMVSLLCQSRSVHLSRYSVPSWWCAMEAYENPCWEPSPCCSIQLGHLAYSHLCPIWSDLWTSSRNLKSWSVVQHRGLCLSRWIGSVGMKNEDETQARSSALTEMKNSRHQKPKFKARLTLLYAAVAALS